MPLLLRTHLELESLVLTSCKCIFFFAFLIPVFSRTVIAQSEISSDKLPEKVTVEKIILIGNTKTKDRIILRELEVEQGQTYLQAELDEILKKDRNKVFNTNLFVTVEVDQFYLGGGRLHVLFKMKERWYVFPAPVFALTDRNFNDWIQNRNFDINRVLYGIRIDHFNFRGRKERVVLVAQFGFRRRFQIMYKIPYVNKRQRGGIGFLIDYTESNKVPVFTWNNREIFLPNNNNLYSTPATEVLRSSFNTSITYSLRNSFYDFHYFTILFKNTNIKDTLVTFNKDIDYFLGGTNKQRYFSLDYTFKHEQKRC